MNDDVVCEHCGLCVCHVSLRARAEQAEREVERLREALRKIERISNGHLGWAAGATREDVHRMMGSIGNSAHAALEGGGK